MVRHNLLHGLAFSTIRLDGTWQACDFGSSLRGAPRARHEVGLCGAPMRAAALFVILTALTASAHANSGPTLALARPSEPLSAGVPAATTPNSLTTPVPPRPATPQATATLCGVLEAAARKDELPLGFFTRLIWRESRFDPAARSSAGAQGVAQFMPATAGERGLLDPFEPTRALEESAGYLRDLYRQFGNWGLAAAAYNAGPGRVSRWLAGGAAGFLPQETIGYVAAVTGHDVEAWRGPQPPELTAEPGFSCLAFAGESGRRAAPYASTDPKAPAPKNWSVIIVGALSRDAALREYGVVRSSHSAVLGPLLPTIVHRRIGGEPIMRYVAQIERDDRASSDQLCRQLQSTGGVCIVLRNSGR